MVMSEFVSLAKFEVGREKCGGLKMVGRDSTVVGEEYGVLNDDVIAHERSRVIVNLAGAGVTRDSR